MKRSVFLAALAAVMAAGLPDVLAAEADTNRWTASLALGVTYNDGNTDSKLVTLGTAAERKTEKLSLKLGVDGAWGEANGDSSADNAKGYVEGRRVITGRLYGLAMASLAYDSIAKVDYRFIASPGLGYYLLKSDAQTLGVEAGPAYVAQELSGEEEDYWALRAAQTYSIKFENGARVWESVEYLPEIADFERYLLTGEIGAEAPLNSHINLRLVVKDAYNSEPAAGREYNDVTVIGAAVLTM